MERLVLFDFDHTITNKDTFIDFIIFYHGWPYFLLKLFRLIPSIILFKFRFISNSKLKELFWTHYFKGAAYKTVKESGISYSSKKLPKLINPKAMEIIRRHVGNSDDIYIVTASNKLWIQDWSEKVFVKGVFGTEYEVINNKFTGGFKNVNLQGIEKVKKIRAEIDIDLYDYIIAYGDSKGDYEMFKLANEAYLKFRRIK